MPFGVHLVSIERVRWHSENKVRKDWPNYILLSHCEKSPICLQIDQFEKGEMKDFDSRPLFRVERPVQDILERKSEMDAIHQLVNGSRLVQVTAASGMGKTLLTRALCYEF